MKGDQSIFKLMEYPLLNNKFLTVYLKCFFCFSKMHKINIIITFKKSKLIFVVSKTNTFILLFIPRKDFHVMKMINDLVI